MSDGLDSGGSDPLRYATGYHAPVLSNAVVEGLVTDPDGVYVDATLGGGGHAAALFDKLGGKAWLIGIDRDEAALDAAAERLPEARRKRFRPVRGNFADITALVYDEGFRRVTGILMDLGISSHQIDEARRGFSFSSPGPLDMRMDQRTHKTAADIVNEWDEQQIRDILYQYGEERRAPRIARELVSRRPHATTKDVADAVRKVTPFKEEVKTLARVFQALRIAVNDEMTALEAALKQSLGLLEIGGRIAVISYHSLEDRRVKHFLRYGNLEGKPVRDFYGNLLTPWKDLTRKPIVPDDREIEANPRARSARLRIAERVELPEGDGPPPPHPVL